MKEGDRVYLRTDPKKSMGTVVKMNPKFCYVAWDVGRTWFYTPNRLEVA